jgi:transposase InsO family protein
MQTHTSAYHPQGNGQVERMNSTLKEEMFTKKIQEDQHNWDVILQNVIVAYQVFLNETVKLLDSLHE